MGNSDEDYAGPEKRQKRNADLRARLDEVAKNVSKNPELTEDDMSPLYELTRDYYRRSHESRSFDMLQFVKEGHASKYNPALLALLDDLMGRRGDAV